MRRDEFIKANASAPKSKPWAKVRTAALGLYSLVVLVVLLALVQLLSDEDRFVASEGPSTSHAELAAPDKPLDTAKAPTFSVQKIVHDIAPEQKPAWLAYAAHWEEVDTPKIAIIIDDLGLSESATLRLSSMRGPYTLAFLPYAEDLPAQTTLVRQSGHELMVHMPMEPQNHEADPGTNALLSGLPRRELDRRISWNLSRFDGFVGINNHMGSLLTEKSPEMDAVMNQLSRRGVLFVDSLTSPDSVALRAAKKAGVPGLARDIFLDNDKDVSLILEQLAKTERIAKSRGYAIAIGHPYDETLEALQLWRQTLAGKGITLVPLSQLVGENEDRVRNTALMANP